MFGKDAHPVFDTNIFTTYREHLQRSDLRRMFFSAIVLYELTARPIPQPQFDEFDNLREKTVKQNRLIVPSYDDIWTSAQAVRKLRLAQQKLHKGTTPALENATKFQNDAIIARSAFSNDCFPVTANTKDFDELRKFMRFDYCSAQDYFGL